MRTLPVLLLAAALCGGGVAAAKCGRCDHGHCLDGRCVCYAGWQGNACQHCGGKLRRDNLTELTDGAGPYPAGTTCSWLVVRRFNVVRLLPERFHVQCGSSHVYVHDGDGMDAPLIAVLSGVLHRNDHHVARSQEITIRSGTAFVHYTTYTDVNASAFRISARVGSCPRDAEGRDCSAHGRCVVSKCLCDSGWTGELCDMPWCPNGCSGSRRGSCDKDGICECKPEYTGEDCSQSVAMGRWEARKPSNRGVVPTGSASHGAVLASNILYVLGGESYGTADLVYTYNLQRNVWRKINTTQPPAPRYGHTAVIHDDMIYMYGGTLEKGRVSSELWALNITSKSWENITVVPENCVQAMCGPIELVGHSANVVFDEYMVVFFGYSPKYGIVNTVQEYYFGNRTWKAVKTYCYPMSGSYGHSSSWDPLSRRIYVLGGYRHASPHLSNQLFSYEPRDRTWKLLFPAPLALYLHTATFVSGGFLLVYGGNGHTDSPSTNCYSPVVLSYDVLCDQWNHLVVRHKPRQTDLARFGHSAFAYSHSLFIYAGYNGQIMSDLVRFTPGSCEAITVIGDCLDSKLGLKCVWSNTRLACMSVDSMPEKPQLGLLASPEDENYRYCKYNESEILAVREEVCSQLPDCLSCISTSLQCAWHDSSRCIAVNVAAKKEKPWSEKCMDPEKMLCVRHHTCRSCLSMVGCTWDQDACRQYSRSLDSDQLSVGECPPSCDDHDNCSNCTEGGCIWCELDRRCVDPEAEVISYPYGQCLLWARQSDRCPAPDESWCGGYQTCADCIHDPACGWCDHGPSAGGTGTCYKGGSTITEGDFCPKGLWNFYDCPGCQCNGHSNCTRDRCIQPCGDDTVGDHCENCDQWFYGNPLNGGQCLSCNCSEDATDCDAGTGQCVCSTKGVVGHHCDICDEDSDFVDDPDMPGLCFYNLPVNYQFVYNASEDEEQFDNINFISRPLTDKINMTFRIECLNNATMNITVRTASGTEKFLVRNYEFSEERTVLERRFRVLEETSKVVTFRVHLRHLGRTTQLSVSFSQAAHWPRGYQYAPAALSVSMFLVVAALSTKYF